MAQNNFVSTLVLGDDGLPSNFVINDEKRVCKIEDRGESRLPPNARPPTAPGTPQHNQVINLADVARQLVDASEQFAPENNTEFVPRAKFEKIISPEVVLQIVRALGCYKDLPQEQQQAIARDIYYGKPYEKPSRKLLAALITTGDKSEPKDKFSAVIQDGVNDHCLPLFNLPSQRGVNQSLLCEGHGRAHQSLEKVVSEGWPSFPGEFLRLCRTLMPPFIVWEDGGKHCHYIMRGGGALPARPDDPPVIRANGGFGEVHKVQIDQGDRNFSLHDNGQNYFALKKLHRRDDLETRSKEFDLEVRSLIFAESRVNRMAGLDQETKEHLIPLLATFEIYHSSEPTYYFLFPWADGNLEDLWKTEDRYRCPRDINQLGFMVHQFYYMAKTLECVHNDRLLIAPNTGSDGHRYGRHGDIKPTNYLYFRNNSDRTRDDKYNIRWQGLRIVLADFGLGSLHRKETKSKLNATNLGHTATYAAPECDDGNSELVSQKSDIFSLGCVFLLHIVWLLEGADLSPTTEASEEYKEEQTVLHCFSKARLHEKDLHPDLDKFKTDRFWKYTKAKGFVIKDSVKDKIEGLKNRDDCVEVVGEMLTVIENGMLQVNKGKRYDAKELVHRLQKIYFNWKHEGNELGDYCTRSWKESKLSDTPSSGNSNEPNRVTLVNIATERSPPLALKKAPPLGMGSNISSIDIYGNSSSTNSDLAGPPRDLPRMPSRRGSRDPRDEQHRIAYRSTTQISGRATLASPTKANEESAMQDDSEPPAITGIFAIWSQVCRMANWVALPLIMVFKFIFLQRYAGYQKLPTEIT